MSSVFQRLYKSTVRMLSSGKTTDQMRAAPIGSVYIWEDYSITYPVLLAKHLGRTDLRIKPAYWLVNPANLSCVRPPAMVIDHATPYSDSVVRAIEYAKRRHIPVLRHPPEKTP